MLRRILTDTLEQWDHEGTRPAVRDSFHKIIACGTPALGAEVYASETERLLVPHTCKSRACPSCGYRATVSWQMELDAVLPDVCYVGINFTIPSIFRHILQRNRQLLHDLPAVAASAIRRWAENKYGARLCLIVVPQTFGGLLNFNPHLLMLVSACGLQESQGEWSNRLRFVKFELMQMWRLALSAYLWLVLRAGVINSHVSSDQIRKDIKEQYKRRWIVYISPVMSKTKFLRYAGRYIRRPPVPLNHIRQITHDQVRFSGKDTRAKCIVELIWPKQMFVAALAEHIPDRYENGVRYFGLLAPRSKSRNSAAVTLLLRQQKRPRPLRLRWADSLHNDFGANPLIDSNGRAMYWTGRLPPAQR